MIKVYWDNEEQTIVRLDYHDPVESWEEYLEAVKKGIVLMRTKSHKVHVIHNPGKTQMPGGSPFTYLREALDLEPTNSGLMVMVISNVFARRMMSLMLKITVGAKNYRFANSIDDAYTLIRNEEQRA